MDAAWNLNGNPDFPVHRQTAQSLGGGISLVGLYRVYHTEFYVVCRIGCERGEMNSFNPGAVAGAASKAAVRNHTKSVALHCAKKGYKTRCNSVHPPAIMTPMLDAMPGEGELRKKRVEEIEDGIPMVFFGKPPDVACVVFNWQVMKVNTQQVLT